MSIKRIVLYYFLLFAILLSIIIAIGDSLILSKHRYENRLFHPENTTEFIKFVNNSDLKSDIKLINSYFNNHINHYTNLKFIGLYKKLDSLLILFHKNHKNIPREFLNIYDTINLNLFNNGKYKKVGLDSISLLLNYGQFIITHVNTSPYYVALLLDRNRTSHILLYVYARIILLIFIILLIYHSITKLILQNLILIRNKVQQLKKNQNINCIKKVGITEFDAICEEIEQLSNHIKIRTQRFYEESIRDPLTGAFNLRKFYEDIENTRKECMNHKIGFVLLIIDVDNFKQINDTLGHLAGDKVLKEIVVNIKKNIRDSDTVYRYGGDEFTVILKNTDREGAYKIAERIRKEIEQNTHTTISIGGSYFFLVYTTTELMREADRKLYIAKKLGKNRTIIMWEDT